MLIPTVQNVPSVLTVLMVYRALLVAQGNTMTLRVSMYVRTVLLDLRRLERVVLHKVLPVHLRIPKSVSHVLPVKQHFKLLPNARRVVLVNPVWGVLVVAILATFAQKERTILELPRPAKTVLLDRRRLTKVVLLLLVRPDQPRVYHVLKTTQQQLLVLSALLVTVKKPALVVLLQVPIRVLILHILIVLRVNVVS